MMSGTRQEREDHRRAAAEGRGGGGRVPGLPAREGLPARGGPVCGTSAEGRGETDCSAARTKYSLLLCSSPSRWSDSDLLRLLRPPVSNNCSDAGSCDADRRRAAAGRQVGLERGSPRLGQEALLLRQHVWVVGHLQAGGVRGLSQAFGDSLLSFCWTG